MKLKIVSFLLFLIVVTLFSSVSALSFEEEVVEVVVEKGDCLIKISERYLEDPRRWPEVARINQLKNPHFIHPGQVIVIPVGLLRGIPADGVVVFIQGDVTVLERDGKEWVPLRLHDRVREGSMVQTGDASAVEFVFDDGTSCLQKSNTLVGFQKVRKKGNSHEQRISLQKGRTITRILKATGREPRFRIETPSAVCAARGTDFRTSVDERYYTRSEVLVGKVEVEAMKRQQMVSEGEGTLVKKGEPPIAPRKLLPPPRVSPVDEVYNTLPLRFIIDPVEGAVSYRIIVTEDRDGKVVSYESIVRPDTPAEIQHLDDGGYFLHLLSIDDIGLEGLPSEPVEIRVRVNPSPPKVIIPERGGVYEEKSIQFEWQTVGDVSGYRLQIARDHLFNQIAAEKTLSGTVYKTEELEYGNYYFRVRSIAADEYEGVWSDTVAFTMAPPPPPPAPEPTQKGSILPFLKIVATIVLIFVLLP